MKRIFLQTESPRSCLLPERCQSRGEHAEHHAFYSHHDRFHYAAGDFPRHRDVPAQ